MSMKSKYRSSYKRRSAKSSNRLLIVILSAVLFCGVIGSGLFLLLRMNAKEEQKTQIELIKAYIAKEDIERGHKITASLLEEVIIKPEMAADYYCTLDCLEQTAAVDIPKGMELLDNMICSPEIKDGQREVECEIVTLSDNLVDNDYVDVRIMMPNGEDYIVLAKKSVHDLNRSEDGQEERCYLWMSEDEILCYSAAIVDAYLYPGSSLYTTRYIEPAIQEPSITTYVPSIGTITMMKENPNLLKEAISHLKENDRKQLENRLTYYLNKDIREVLWKEAESSSDNTTENVPAKQDENAISVNDDEKKKEEGKEDNNVEESKTENSDIKDSKKEDNKTEDNKTEDNKTQDSKEEDRKDDVNALSVFVDDSETKEAPAE